MKIMWEKYQIIYVHVLIHWTTYWKIRQMLLFFCCCRAMQKCWCSPVGTCIHLHIHTYVVIVHDHHHHRYSTVVWLLRLPISVFLFVASFDFDSVAFVRWRNRTKIEYACTAFQPIAVDINTYIGAIYRTHATAT